MLVIALTLLGVWGYTVCADDVTKETEGALAKLTFLLVQGDSGCLEALKHGKKSLLVFLLVFSIDNVVTHQAQDTKQVVKNLIHPAEGSVLGHWRYQRASC